MATKNSFFHIDVLRVVALVWSAVGAADRGLEIEEEENEEVAKGEFKEFEEGWPVTLLTMRLSE